MFQEKRGDREVEHLFRSLELITEIKEGQVGSSDWQMEWNYRKKQDSINDLPTNGYWVLKQIFNSLRCC